MSSPITTKQLESDFKRVSRFLRHISDGLRNAGYSYPVFLSGPSPAPIGELLITPNEIEKNQLYYHVINLEQLETAGLIENSTQFIQNYPDPEHSCCLCTQLNGKIVFAHINY